VQERRTETDARGTASSVPAPARVPLPEPGHVGQLLALQRSAGNQAVSALLSRQPADTAAALVPDAQMDADVEFICAKLKEQILTADEEQEIVDVVRRWADSDTDALIRGQESQGQLDRFVLKLKVRAITRSTARSAFFFETTVNAFDTLFHELEDERLAEFRRLLLRSRRYAGAGPESDPSENVWSTVGRQELIGMFGMMKGLSTGLASVGDVAAWAALKQANMYLLPFGQKIDDPGKMADWIGKQLDISGDFLFEGEFTGGEELFLGQNAASIGTVGGSVIWNLVMLHGGSGAGSTGAGMLPQGMKALDLVSKFKGVDDALTSMGDYLLRMQEKGKLTRDDLLADDEFKIECFKLAGAVVGAIGGGLGATGDTAKAVQVAMEKLALVFKAGELGAKLGEISQLLMDDSLEPAAQRAAVGKLVMELVSDAFSIVGDKAAAADKARAEAQHAQMRFNERTLDVIPALPLETEAGASQEGRAQPGIDEFGMLDLDVVDGPPLELDPGATQDVASQPDDYGMVDLAEAAPEQQPAGDTDPGATQAGGGGGGGGGGAGAAGAIPTGHVETVPDLRAAQKLYMDWVTRDPSREVEIMTHADGRVFVVQGSPGEGVMVAEVARRLGVKQGDLASARHYHNPYDPSAPGMTGGVGKRGKSDLAVQVPSVGDLNIFAKAARRAGKPYRSEINYHLPDGRLGQTTVVVTPNGPDSATYSFWVRRGPTKGLRASFTTAEQAQGYWLEIVFGSGTPSDTSMPAVPAKR
jgi:hypothetical protein